MQKEGVGEMTPSIIKLPFWEMTYKNEKVFYACLNQKKSSAPEHIKDKGIYIAGDLAETLRDLKENIAGKEMLSLIHISEPKRQAKTRMKTSA